MRVSPGPLAYILAASWDGLAVGKTAGGRIPGHFAASPLFPRDAGAATRAAGQPDAFLHSPAAPGGQNCCQLESADLSTDLCLEEFPDTPA